MSARGGQGHDYLDGYAPLQRARRAAANSERRYLVGNVGSLAWAFDGVRLHIAHVERPVHS